MTLIIGSNTVYSTAGYGAGQPGGQQGAFRFVALATDTLGSLVFRIGESLSSTALTLSIYSDNAGLPDALLGSADVTSGLAVNSWATAPGLSVPLVSGTYYHLAILPSIAGGGLQYFFSSNPLEIVPFHYGDATGLSAPSNPYGSSAETLDYPAVGFYGDTAGAGTGVTPPTDLEFHLTGPWLPSATTVPYYGRVADPQSGSECVIPLNDSRTASVTMSTFDPVVETLAGLTQIPYAVYLKVYYRAQLVFWGPVKVHAVDYTAGTVRLDAVDMSLRFTNHYLRRDDLLLAGGKLTEANQDQGYLPVSGAGVALVRDAVQSSSFPTLGVDTGVDSFTVDPNARIGVTRGDQAWQKVQDIQSSLGPDVELAPDESTAQRYATLNTVDRQGSDKSATVVFHHGTGRQNLEGLQVTEGETYCNMVHVLDRDGKIRVTVVNSTALARTGPYVRWEHTDYDAPNGASDANIIAVLQAHGKTILAAYGQPSLALALILPLEDDTTFHYIEDFIVGDTVGVAGKSGFETLPEFGYRIMQCAIRLDGEGVRLGLDVVADRSTADTVSTTDPEV